LIHFSIKVLENKNGKIDFESPAMGCGCVFGSGFLGVVTFARNFGGVASTSEALERAARDIRNTYETPTILEEYTPKFQSEEGPARGTGCGRGPNPNCWIYDVRRTTGCGWISLAK
jgi:hypothetical protein